MGGKYMYKVNLFNMKMLQLDRLIAHTDIGFDKAFMIIFSDYPTLSYVNTLLEQTNINNFSDKLKRAIKRTKNRLEKECF